MNSEEYDELINSFNEKDNIINNQKELLIKSLDVINTMLCLYCPEGYGEEYTRIANKKTWEAGGTIAYCSDMMEEIRKVVE